MLLGEYGSGKSRCIREVFRLLSTHAVETLAYPVAINLRQSWGLSRSSELLRRHLQDLGLDDLEGAAIRAFKSGSVALMLDGFDEVGSQAWSNDGQKLKIIRAKSLQGVKNIITESKGGVLITGREHYFPNSAEMFSALGLDPKKTIVARSKNEFSDTELLEYFSQLDMEVDIPSWLPRRPLICQTIANLDAETFNTMFGSEGNEVDFWNHFIRVICERDARIHVSFDPDTIFAIFVQLARLTRTKAANVGPISLNELQSAFEAVTGAAPIEEASLMLQRLPSLGRVSAETNDRQFVDVYILDGLRAKDAARICIGTEIEIAAVSGAKWHNALDDLGQRVLALDSTSTAKLRLSLAERFSQLGNMVLASDLVSSLSRETDGSSMDFSGLKIDHGDFLYFPLFERELRNLTVTNSYIGELALPAKKATNVTLANCATPKVSGIASAAGLPKWISSLDAEQFDSVESISRIRKIGLQPSHEILITIIRKTFFQKGSGRKEEALLRGLGMVGTKNLSKKILSAMITEGLLTSFKGDEGNVYAPVRAHAPRMQTILDELKSSKDPLWLAIAEY
ncbi:hypothetical protein [Mesorhizobium sp. M0220]|uniref:hypothetical protein n=1 Tax=Mesorhizobium sp. M0220 TaxID=2956920 RepID=UPI00333C30C5